MSSSAEYENMQILRLIESMLGSVSHNVRRVAIDRVTSNGVRIRFLLEHESSEDREDIDDIIFEFDARQDNSIHIDVDVIVDSRPIQEAVFIERAVYYRKE